MPSICLCPWLLQSTMLLIPRLTASIFYLRFYLWAFPLLFSSADLMATSTYRHCVPNSSCNAATGSPFPRKSLSPPFLLLPTMLLNVSPQELPCLHLLLAPLPLLLLLMTSITLIPLNLQLLALPQAALTSYPIMKVIASPSSLLARSKTL